MDYLGWELERQRTALAALLGGGDTREFTRNEALRNGAGKGLQKRREDQGPSFADIARESAAIPAAEVLRATAQHREDREARAIETSVSAWEAILGGEKVWTARQEDRESGGIGISETPVSTWETILGEEVGIPAGSGERAWLPQLSGGTGTQREFLRPSGLYTIRKGMGQAEANLAAEAQDSPAGSGRDGAGGTVAPPEAGISQGRVTGDHAAAGRPGRFRKVGRSGESTADTQGWDESEVGTAPWGGWRTAALRAEDSAKTLSRAVQRDARRYDGGFNIY